MPVDLRAALRAALDVDAPSLRFERLYERAALRVRALERRRSRTILAAGALVAMLAVFAGGQATTLYYPPVAVAPAPAPSPLAT